MTTVRLSDREWYSFSPSVLSGGSLGGGSCLGIVSFTQVDGWSTGATLEIVGNNIVFSLEENIYDDETFGLYNPGEFVLTTPDQRRITVERGVGVTRIRDRNFNQIDIGPDGVSTSTGTSLTFVRDGSGRITSIIDPSEGELHYSYDSRGDLVSFENQTNDETTFTYDLRHNLIDIIDPLGFRGVRNEYDDDGRHIATIDALGHRMEIDHDLGESRETVTNRLGYSMTYEYDQWGNVVLETYPGSPTVTVARSFDNRGNLLSERNELGHTTSYTYDSRNLKLTETNALAETATWTYSFRGDVETFTNALGETSTTTYDNRGNVVAETDAGGFTTTFTNDSYGQPYRECDPRGHCRTMLAGPLGQYSRVVDKRGTPTEYTYDDSGRLLTETTTRSVNGSVQTLVTTHVYDEAGRELSVEHPDGAIERTEYDGRGLVIARIDALGRRTEMDYDAAGRHVETRYADGSEETTVYDAEGRATSRTDRGGRTRTMAYDIRARLTAVTFDGASTLYGYDAAGRMTTMTDRRGNATTSTFDAAGRLIESEDALGNVTTRGYNSAGRLVSETDAKNRTKTFEHDARGLLVRTVHADSSESGSEYDETGNEVAAIDQEARRTEYTFDEEGNLASVANPNGETWVYGYDELGNLIAQTDPLGHTTTMTFDERRREASRGFAIGNAEQRSYDLAGNLASKQSRMGFVTTYVYDSNNRVIARGQPEGLIQQSWSPTGQRLTAVDARGTTTFGYDEHDRLESTTYPNGHALEYGRDANGNVTSMSALVGATTWTETYGYDELNRISSVTAEGVTYELEYDATGQLAELRYPSGLTTTYAYDALDRLTSIETRNSSNEIVLGFSYGRSTGGNILTIEESSGLSHEYRYDEADRLTEEVVRTSTGVVYAEGFEYDAAGNRSLRYYSTAEGMPELTYSSYDARDRLMVAGADAISWDEDGRMLSRSGSEGYTLTWDSQDRLLAIDYADGARVENMYDADGTLVGYAQRAGAGTSTVTELIVARTGGLSHVVAEASGGAVRSRFVRADGRVLAHLESAMLRGALLDNLGSTRALMDSAGNVTDTFSYYAFGRLRARTGSADVSVLFAGERFDPSQTMSQNRARWLAVDTGSFLSADRFEGWTHRPPSLTRYNYADSAPVSKRDPTGYFSTIESSQAAAGQQVVAASSTLNTASYFTLRRVAVLALLVPATATVLAPDAALDADQARRRGQRRRGLSVFIPGLDTPATSRHIVDNIRSHPENAQLTKFTGRAALGGRSWYDRAGISSDCDGSGECDEYPFFSTIEGGPENFPGRVTLKQVPFGESAIQGGRLRGFYSSCNLPDGARYIVRPSPSFRQTTWICGDRL